MRRSTVPRAVRASRPVWSVAVVAVLLTLAVLPGAGAVAWAEPTISPTATAPPAPVDSPTSPARPTPTDPDDPTPTPTEPPDPTPTPTPTPTPSPSPSVSSPSASRTAPPPVTTAPRPPAIEEADANPVSLIIAAGILLAAVVGVLLVVRRPQPVGPGGTPVDPGHTQILRPGGVGAVDTAARLASLEAVGEAMLDAGYSVTGVRSALEDIATVNGYPDTEIVVLPTALLVSARGVEGVSTGAVSTGDRPLMMNQIDALDDVVKQARSTPQDPLPITAAVAAARVLPRPYTRVQRVIAHAVLSGSLAVLLGSSWAGIPVAMGLGAVVATALVLTADYSRAHQALVTVGASFVVSATVFSITGAGLDAGVLAAMIAPLASLLPGGLLTTGVIELATGNMMSGAGRVAGGLMQLMLLATGILGGAALVGIPAITFDAAENPIGPLGPWLAVAVFGVSMVIYRCGRLASVPWVVLVLYVAYGAQVIGDLFFGGVLSAMIGAFAMTPVAYLVATRSSGPAAFTSFLPAFWMLVPGALGLVGVASIVGGESAGLTALATTAATMVAITLGILAGSMIGARLAGRGIVVAV